MEAESFVSPVGPIEGSILLEWEIEDIGIPVAAGSQVVFFPVFAIISFMAVLATDFSGIGSAAFGIRELVNIVIGGQSKNFALFESREIP